MKNNYVTPINKAGLPIHSLTKKANGLETLRNLSRLDVMELYWRLKGLEFHFKYEIEGKLYNHKYEFKIKESRHSRIVSAPFVYMISDEYTEPYGIYFKMAMDLSTIRYTKEEKGYAYQTIFVFMERDAGYNFYLGLTVPDGWHVVDRKTIYFMNCPLELKLSLKHKSDNGRIIDAEVRKN